MTKELVRSIANQIAYYLQEEINRNDGFLDDAFSHTQYQYPGLPIEDINTLQNTQPFKRQALLKEKISNIPTINSEDMEQKWRWIVNSWGGIRQFNVRTRITECINPETYNGNYISYLNDKLCTLASISSFSKIASFTKPEDWFVYDSRVTYVLDWLLFKCGGNKQDILYFRIPDSYSNRRGAISQLIGHNTRYFTKSDCYAKYCELVKTIGKIFPLGRFSLEDNLVCQIEMILFALGKNGGIIDSEIRQNNRQRPQSAPNNSKKAETMSSSQSGSDAKSESHTEEETNTAEPQGLSLKVYNGSGASYGKTFQIINQSNHSPASSVFLVYQDETIEASVGTYNNGHNTLRKADTITRFIKAHQLQPGQLIQCTFKNENGCHKYLIERTLPEQSE